MCSQSSGDGRAVGGLALDDVVPPDVAALGHRRASGARRRGGGRRGRARSSACPRRPRRRPASSGIALPRRQPPSAVMTSFAWASLMRPLSASAEKPPKTTVCGRADPGAGEHRDRQLRDHRHVDRDPVARADAELLERVGRLLDLALEVGVGDRPRVARLADPVVGDLVAEAVLDVAVDAVVGDVQLAADEPLRERQVPLERRRRTASIQVMRLAGELRPEGLGVALGLVVEVRGRVGLRGERRVGREALAPRRAGPRSRVAGRRSRARVLLLSGLP